MTYQEPGHELGRDVLKETLLPYERAEISQDKLAIDLMTALAAVKQNETDQIEKNRIAKELEERTGVPADQKPVQRLSDLLEEFIDPNDTLASLEHDSEENLRINEAKNVLVDKFCSAERMLSPDDFGVVEINKDRTKSLYIVLTSRQALYRGS